ncbi:MAG: hypothetical protein ACRDRQ_14175 [Pseudonocardiaceae bacterium]
MVALKKQLNLIRQIRIAFQLIMSPFFIQPKVQRFLSWAIFVKVSKKLISLRVNPAAPLRSSAVGIGGLSPHSALIIAAGPRVGRKTELEYFAAVLARQVVPVS